MEATSTHRLYPERSATGVGAPAAWLPNPYHGISEAMKIEIAGRLKNKPHTTGQSSLSRGREGSDYSKESSRKARPQETAGANAGGCSGQTPLRTGDSDGEGEKPLVTDGGVAAEPWCPHRRTRRIGTVDAAGDAVIEERCISCGRTLSLGGGA